MDMVEEILIEGEASGPQGDQGELCDWLNVWVYDFCHDRAIVGPWA